MDRKYGLCLRSLTSSKRPRAAPLFLFSRWDVRVNAVKETKRKRKDSAGSDDTASIIKGGGYLGARTSRHPPTEQIIKKRLMWVRGVVCRSTWTQSLTVVACVILQCIPCCYECRCMSDGVFVQFVNFLVLW